MSEQNCGNCRFWKEDSKDSYEGVCRRYPPTAHFYQYVGDGCEDVYYSAFAETAADQWCGEWQPEKPKANPSEP